MPSSRDMVINWANEIQSGLTDADLKEGNEWIYVIYHEILLYLPLTHIWVSDLTTIGSDNGLSPGLCQTIIWANTGMLLIRPLGKKTSVKS